VTEAEVEAINTEASELMHRGMAFLEDPRREAPIDALHCFDEALELRRRIPAGHSPHQGYLLAACLLNRGDALVRMADVGPIAAALTSYDEAVTVLRQLPLADNPLYPRRLALGLQNRALALQARGREGDIDLAAASFADALAVLDEQYSQAIEDGAYVRAVVWLNLANLHAMQSTDEAHVVARDAAMHALESVSRFESSDPNAAAAGLQARHVLCRVCAHSLSQTADDDDMPADVHEATDFVDDGLALVRAWEQRGFPHFRPFALDLFRFGARVYARYQPQFLDEFIADNMDPAASSPDYVQSAEMVMAAHEARLLIPRENV
jgi:intracellular sulfur oxidation DsrE/DsrF family protein